MNHISTGKAAELLSVTPDAVLKWIKKGKLPARKTAGGHYRISLDSIKDLLDTGKGPAFENLPAGKAYYKEQSLQPVNVLIFTDSETLKKSLKEQSKYSALCLQFAGCEYDCSFVVDSFRPEYVVLDCAKGLSECEELCEHLCEHLRNDPRIPGVKIMFALPPDLTDQIHPRTDVVLIKRPHHIAELESCIANCRENALP